jgi:HEAT repeat protein
MTDSQLETYRRMGTRDRVAFLESRVEEGVTVDLSSNFLVEAIAEETDPTAQWFLVKGIGQLRVSEAIESLLAVCRAPEVEMGKTSLHAICAWSLGKIGPPAYDKVLTLLSDPNWETRRTAVDALGEIGDVRAIPVLCHALERDEYKVKIWAGLSLAKMGPSALPCLNRIKGEADQVGQIIASDAIVKIGQKQVVIN